MSFHYLFAYVSLFKAATAEDTKVALRTFDEYMHLMTLIEPQCIQEELQTANIFPNNNIFISATTESSSILMEKIVSEVRCCIELNGAQIFLAFVNVLQAEGRYVVLGYHIFSKFLYKHGALMNKTKALLLMEWYNKLVIV